MSKSPALEKVPVLRLFEQISVDFVGPFPTSLKGNRYILVAVENFSRWPIAMVSENADDDNVADFLYSQVFTVFGPFQFILSDNASHFSNDIVEKFLALVKVHHPFTFPYHPECNGMVEKLNGTLVKALKKLCISDPLNWDFYLPSVLYSYRTKAHETVHMSPYKLLFGLAPRTFCQNLLQQLDKKLGFERLVSLTDQNSFYEDHKEYPTQTTYESTLFPIGSKVIRLRKKRTNKLQTTFKPEVFTVVAAYKNNT